MPRKPKTLSEHLASLSQKRLERMREATLAELQRERADLDRLCEEMKIVDSALAQTGGAGLDSTT